MLAGKYLGDKIFWRNALALGTPIALQNLLTSSLSLVDTIMIGSLGDIPLSAVGMAGQFGWLMQLVLFGLSSGSAVFISQFWGSRDMKGINGIHGIMLLHMCAVSAAFFLFAFFLPETVIGIFNRNASVIAEGAAYLKTAAFSYVAIAITMAISTVLRSTECVRLPLITSIITTAENALLNYVFIYGKLGAPAMGAPGAALATAISAWTGVAILILVSRLRQDTAAAPLRSLIGFGKTLLRRFYSVSTPAILNESMWGLGTFCYNVIFGRLGYEYYAAVTIFRTVDGITFTFFVGLCNACCIMVGKYIGMGDIKSALRDSRRFAVIVPLLSAAVGGLLILLRAPIVSVFSMGNSITELTKSTAMALLVIYGAEYGMRNIPYIQVVGIFRPGGDTSTGLKYDTLCLWGISLPLTFIAAFVLKLPFVFVFAVMLFAEDSLKVFLCIRRFRSKKWLKPITPEGKAGLEAYLKETSETAVLGS